MENVEKLAAALAKAQSEIEGAKKGKKNDHFKSKYADLASIWDACREALTSNGLSVVQMPTLSNPGSVGLTTILLHESGQMLSDTFHMPIKDATNPQAVGSALTYARRYALAAFVSVCPEDDDGNAASAKPVAQSQGYPSERGRLDLRLQRAFDETSDLNKKKTIFMQAKSAQLDEPTRTSILRGMSEVILKMTNEQKAQEGTKESK